MFKSPSREKQRWILPRSDIIKGLDFSSNWTVTTSNLPTPPARVLSVSRVRNLIMKTGFPTRRRNMKHLSSINHQPNVTGKSPFQFRVDWEKGGGNYRGHPGCLCVSGQFQLAEMLMLIIILLGLAGGREGREGRCKVLFCLSGVLETIIKLLIISPGPSWQPELGWQSKI